MSEQAKPATSSLPAVVRLADRRRLKGTRLRRTSALARSTALEGAPLAAASDEQRRKVDGRGCVVCGN